jgi:hypothetical protein
MTWTSVHFDDPERTYDVDYKFHKGYRGRGPSWSSPGEPPEPDEVELLHVTPKPEELFPFWAPVEAIAKEYERIELEVLEGHDQEWDGPDPDYAYESRRDDPPEPPWSDYCD